MSRLPAMLHAAWSGPIVALLATLSATGAAPHQAQVAAPAGLVTVVQVDNSTWRATYELPGPVRALRFARAAAFFRERVWTVRTPGYHWSRDGGQQVLRADTAVTPQSTVVVEFPPYSDVLPKEYEFFQPFTDGGVAIYTGHLHATPDGATAGTGAPEIRVVRIVPPSGAGVVVRGRVSNGPLTFADSVGDGTYAYIGSARPIETESLIAIVDPGLPDWLRTQFDRFLPRLFAAYRERFLVPLPWKPVVLYSFHDTASGGYSSGGGTLTGLISMTLTGAAWRTRNDDAASQAFQLLAHESAHLWNGQLITSRGDSAAWMHEGSADAMANDMLLGFGQIDTARHRMNREEAINQCAAQLSSGAVHGAARRGAFRVFYDCGTLMALWADAAVGRARPGANLATFWKELVAAGTAQGGWYDEDLYFSVLRHLGVTDAVTGQMRAFLDGTTVEIAIRGLRSVGVDVRRGEVVPPARLQQSYARTAMVHLMSVACGRVDLTWGVPIETGAVRGCAPFATAMHVFGIEGRRVRDEGAAIHDAVVMACASRGDVTLNGDGGSTIATITCTRPLTPRPPWYSLPQP